jgi:ABC-type multidrug transport system ATPase subunit
MKPKISVRGVSKAYKSVQALRELSLDVQEGELFGLIGPDGAGKTTLIRILATLLLPDQGQATLNGLDSVKDYLALRKQLGYMPGRFSLYRDLTVEENLQLFARLFGTDIRTHYSLIEDIYVQLEPFRKRRASALSGGMKQKLALCCALIHSPEILLLDEPTTGVDAVSRREFWDMLAKRKAEGITIFVTTPYMDEAGRCDRVGLIQNGRLLELASPSEVEAGFTAPLYAVSGPGNYLLLQALRRYPRAASVFPFGESIHYTDQGGEADLAALRAFLAAEGLGEARIERIRPSIEDRFMALMSTH